MKTNTLPTKPEAPAELSCSALLGIWWSTMPDWVKRAYHNCPTCNRVIKECAMRETTKTEMQWELCAAMYEQRNQWRETAISLKEQMPIVVEMPNE